MVFSHPSNNMIQCGDFIFQLSIVPGRMIFKCFPQILEPDFAFLDNLLCFGKLLNIICFGFHGLNAVFLGSQHQHSIASLLFVCDFFYRFRPGLFPECIFL